MSERAVTRAHGFPRASPLLNLHEVRGAHLEKEATSPCDILWVSRKWPGSHPTWVLSQGLCYLAGLGAKEKREARPHPTLTAFLHHAQARSTRDS